MKFISSVDQDMIYYIKDTPIACPTKIEQYTLMRFMIIDMIMNFYDHE